MSEKNIRPRHDQLMKHLMTDLSFSRGFFEYLLPLELREKLDINRLSLTKSSYVDNQLSEHFADVVFEVPYSDKSEVSAKLVLLLEHKSYKDEKLPYQLMRYLSNGYVDQIINNKSLAPIFPVIFYHGRDRWDLKKIRAGFSGVYVAELNYVPEFDWVFINTHDLEESSLLQLEDALLLSVLLTKKYSHHPDALLKRIKTIVSALSQASNYHHRQVILLYLWELVPKEKDLISIIQKTDPRMAKEFISHYEATVTKSREEGLEKKKREVIYKAYFEEGLPLNLISRLVAAPETEVAAIIEEMEQRKEP